MGFPLSFPPIINVDRAISLVVPIVSIFLFPLVGFLVFAYLKENKKAIAVMLVALSTTEDLSNKSDTEEIEIVIKSPDDRLRFDGAAEQSYICKPKTAGFTDCNYAWIEIPVEMKIAVPKLEIAGGYMVEILVPDNRSLCSKPIIELTVWYYLTDNFKHYSVAAFIPTLLVVAMPLLLRKRRYK